MYNQNRDNRNFLEPVRRYKFEWKNKFCFIQCDTGIKCVLCNTILTTVKVDRVRYHYINVHKTHPIQTMVGKERIDAIEKLTDQSTNPQKLPLIIDNRKYQSKELEFMVSTYVSQRGLSLGEGAEIFALFKKMFTYCKSNTVIDLPELSLSRRSLTDKVEHIADTVIEKLTNILSNKLLYYSLCLDESTDIVCTAQVMYYIRFVDDEYNTYEQFLCLDSLSGHVNAETLYNSFIHVLDRYKLDHSKCVSVTTDGCNVMRGVHNGLIALIKRTSTLSHIFDLHCILHQQNLAAKNTELGFLFEDIVALITSIRGKDLTYRKFRSFLDSSPDTKMRTLPYHTAVRWLSRSKSVERVIEARSIISDFCKEEELPCILDSKTSWLNINFLADILKLHQILNLQLQGYNNNICSSINAIKVFVNQIKIRMECLQKHLIGPGEFPHLSNAIVEFPPLRQSYYDLWIDECQLIIESYSQRFIEFNDLELTVQLVYTPLAVKQEDVSLEFKDEHFRLINDIEYINAIKSGVEQGEVWKTIGSTYPKLRLLFFEVRSLFTSTYTCEKGFSHMKSIKSDKKSQLTDIHLEDQLRIQLNTFELDNQSLARTYIPRRRAKLSKDNKE